MTQTQTTRSVDAYRSIEHALGEQTIHEVELVISSRPRTFYIVDGDPTEHKYLTHEAAEIASRLMAQS